MEKKESNINEQEIDFILNNDLDTNFWMYQLGVSTSDNTAFNDNRFSFPFLEEGKKYWNEFKKRLKELLCDSTKNEPNKITSEIVGGDIRLVVIYYFGIITKNFNFTAQVTIPLVAIILKMGLNNLCNDN